MLLAMIPIPIIGGLMLLAISENKSDALAVMIVYVFFISLITVCSAIFLAMPIQAVLSWLGLFKWYMVACVGAIAGALLGHVLSGGRADNVVILIFSVFGTYGGFWYWYGADKLFNKALDADIVAAEETNDSPVS